MKNQVIGVLGLIGFFALFELLGEVGAGGVQSPPTQVGKVPVKDVPSKVTNNSTDSPLNVIRGDGRIYRRRPGYFNRTRPYRRRYRSRFYDDIDDDMYSPEDTYRDWRAYPRRRENFGACNLRRNRGRCQVSVRRWYYNNIVQQCRPFTYSGCGGNRNNFMSLKTCRDSCVRGQGDKMMIRKQEAISQKVWTT